MPSKNRILTIENNDAIIGQHHLVVAESMPPTPAKGGYALKATAWNNGSPRPSGAGYGIRISKTDRDSFFVKTWNTVQINVPGVGTIQASLSKSFWKNCCEIRSKSIGRWLMMRGLASWKRNFPPAVQLVYLGGTRFMLRR